MKSKLILMTIVSSASFSCLADPALDGKYKATWDANGKSFEAILVIDGNGGNWNAYAQKRANPCVGKEVPIAVNAPSADDINIDLQFTKILQGCTDVALKLKRTGPNTLAGTRSSGGESSNILVTKD